MAMDFDKEEIKKFVDHRDDPEVVDSFLDRLSKRMFSRLEKGLSKLQFPKGVVESFSKPKDVDLEWVVPAPNASEPPPEHIPEPLLDDEAEQKVVHEHVLQKEIQIDSSDEVRSGVVRSSKGVEKEYHMPVPDQVQDGSISTVSEDVMSESQEPVTTSDKKRASKHEKEPSGSDGAQVQVKDMKDQFDKRQDALADMINKDSNLSSSV